MNLAIVGGRVVTPEGIRPETVLVDGDRIVSVGEAEIPSDARRIDAAGKLVAPGLVDLGVFAMDLAAFTAGGITRAALMPDASPPLDNAALIQRAAAAGKPEVWIHPLAAATAGLAGIEMAEIGLMARAGACGVATGRRRIADSGRMLRLLSYAAALGLVVVVHAEDEGLAAGAVATDGEMATRLGLPSAPAAAEALAVARDLLLAEEAGAHIHFRQLTTAAAFDLVRQAKRRGVRVTCGITPAHLLLSDVAIGNFRTFARLSPPLRSDADRKAALAALADGTIDVLCSGHDPLGPEAKRLPFADAEPGAAGAQTLLALGLTLVRDGVVSLERLIALMTENPARLLGLPGGTIEAGAPADIILVDEDAPWRISADRLQGEAGNTPFDGLPVQGLVTAVVKGGRVLA